MVYIFYTYSISPNLKQPINPQISQDLTSYFYLLIRIIFLSLKMSRKLKYKIISCSSEDEKFPVTSLLFSESEGWRTNRFCTYPQEITVQFYGVANIRKFELVSDHRKIASQVDILFYVPTGSQQQRFYKYGYFQFSKSDSGSIREQKSIVVDINCLYLRFLFHKPHPTKQNFFSQVGIISLSFFGSDHPEAPMYVAPERAEITDGTLNEEDEDFITKYTAQITAYKEQSIRMENYDKAERHKQELIQLNNFANKLRQQRAKIARALENEDYDDAKLIKEQILKNKRQISEILETEEESPEQQEEENQFANIGPQQNNNEFMQPQSENPASLANSKHSGLANSRPIKNHKNQNLQQERSDYDERVIPTLRGDRVKSQPQQFGQQKPKAPPPVEEVEGKFIKQALVMQEYFDELTVKKFFSQYWQHNQQALSTILSDVKKKNKDSGLIKCLAKVVKFSITQTNFQVAVLSLGVLQQMLKINKESQSLTKPGQMQNDLDDISRQVTKKMTDNNPKIKQAAQQAFALMVSSLLYGVEACSTGLTKSKSKLSSKQLCTRLGMISKMIEDYGLSSGSNTVPLSALDFAIQNLNNSAEEVRKSAVSLLSTAYRRDKAKAQTKISGLKDSILNQIHGQGVQTPPRNKKK